MIRSASYIRLREYRTVIVALFGYALLAWLAWLGRGDPSTLASLGWATAAVAGAQAARSGAGAVAEAKAQAEVGKALAET